jgi:hypothetical protein
MNISGTQTEQNFKTAIVGEHHALEKFLRWNNIADVVGPPEVHNLYRLTGLLVAGHQSVGQLYKQTLREAIADHAHHAHHVHHANFKEPEPSVEFTQTDVEKYLEYADVAANEGFQEIAEWFTALSEAERSQIPKTV